jgi:hypothetical protein
MPRIGRPNVSKEDLAEFILFRLANGEGLNAISRSLDEPS